VRCTRSVAVALALVIASIGLPAAAADNCSQKTANVSGEVMAGDALLARPFGLVSMGVGAIVYAISLPFTLPAGSEQAARTKFIQEPAAYTFSRCLGDYRGQGYVAEDER